MNPPIRKPLLIGVTGGIGSGKSTVCRMFEAFGVPIYPADERAKWLVEYDAILRADITRLLGPDAYDLQGRYNRVWVAATVFDQPDLLQQLNQLIHPRVMADTASWVQDHATHPYLVKEAAIMKAASTDNLLHKVVVVHSPLPLRIQRILLRDPHRSEEQIRHIISRQSTDAERFQIADYIVYNDESQLLIPQVVQLHEAFSAGVNSVSLT